jgi:hypothetical protein
MEWLRAGRGVILHAGGQSRRLPGYAAEGKALIPVPVFRWSRGQRLDQVLLDLQLPLLERVLAAVSGPGHWLIASGDVLLHGERLPLRLPEADVWALGLWGEAEQATRHGVFFTPRGNPGELCFMKQKPGLEAMREAMREHYFMLDVGVWVLGPAAIEVLLGKVCEGDIEGGELREFDLYGEFGPALGTQPEVEDSAIGKLRTSLIEMEDGEFYHFGSGPDLLKSCLQLQNRVIDQRRITSHDIKPHPSIFVQNSKVASGKLTEANSEIWIENACIGEGWELERRHILTGIEENRWEVALAEGICVERMPLRTGGVVLRVYGYADPFRGAVGDEATVYCGKPLRSWLVAHGLTIADLGCEEGTDLQQAPLFPVVETDAAGELLQWWLNDQGADPQMRERYLAARRISAEDISAEADLLAVARARQRRRHEILPVLAANAGRSVFHQVDLHRLAQAYAESGSELTHVRPDARTDLFRHVHDSMFRSEVMRWRGNGEAAR